MSGVLHAYLAESVERDPHRVAIHDGPRAITYAQLDSTVQQLSAALAGHGLRAGDRMAIWTEKRAETLALMQAALRLGVIYVPVAPSNPSARVEQIVQLATASFVVTDGPIGFRARLGSASLEFLLASAPQLPVDEWESGPNDPAYILFASGSTGVPKGVTVTHANARAFVDWAATETALTGNDRLSSHAPFSFDLSVFDIDGAFRSGASVDLIPSSTANNGAALARFIRDREITVWYSVPSALMLMIDHGDLFAEAAPSNLRTMIFAGEPFPLARAKALLRAWPGVRTLNWYGPTETNVCTGYELTPADLGRTTSIPIGYPASGAHLHLLPGPDEGEILVDGPTVMRGYWGQPDQAGPYATGDFGRRGPSGEIQYLGRGDGLVKIRGYRVELGDIEAVLSLHEAVNDVAVLAIGEGIDRKLTAAVVPVAGQRLSLLALKGHAAAHLPTYMIVDTLRIMDELPRTPNGKVDRTHLAEAFGKDHQ